MLSFDNDDPLVCVRCEDDQLKGQERKIKICIHCKQCNRSAHMLHTLPADKER